jgi:hypothetical protein
MVLPDVEARMSQRGKRNNGAFWLPCTLTCLLLAVGVELFVQQPAAALQRNPALDQLGSDQQKSVALPQATSCNLTPPPAYQLLRDKEDYSYLKDPRCRTDFWDAIKYIPLGSQQGWYLSLGGELRERYEFFHNEEAGSQLADRHGNNSYALQRYLLHGDLHLGARLRFFAQIMSGLENGRSGGPR